MAVMLTELRKVFQRAIGTGPVWSYRDDFNEVWTLLATGGVKGDHVLLWDETPPGDGGDVDTSPFVSPLHWAACGAAVCSRNATPFRATILDLNPQYHHKDVPLWLPVHTLSRERVSWLRLVQVTELAGGGHDDLRMRLGLGGDTPTPKIEVVRVLMDDIRLGLSDPAHPDNRHSIANLVGPLLLLEGKLTTPFIGQSPDGQSAHVNALRTVLEQCGLLPKPPKEESPAPVTAHPQNPADIVTEKARGEFHLIRGTRVVLLDDQWHQGWGEWVCKQLGVEFQPLLAKPARGSAPQRISKDADIEVYAADDPTWLLKRLALKQDQKDKRFELTLGEVEAPAGELLLLDLRLFAGNVDRESEFVKELLKLCERFSSGDHAWPGFASNLDDVEKWCGDPGAFSEEERDRILLIARGLLGRLVALTDFSFPIVVFSSTADRQLIEGFKPYGNIITSFSKPRTFGHVALRDGDEVSSSLQVALRAAIRIGSARQFLRREVLALARTTRLVVQEALGASSAAVEGRYAELYVDETWSTVKRVGGYAIVYCNEKTGPTELWTHLSLEPQWGFSREQQIDRTVRPSRFVSPDDRKSKASSLFEGGRALAVSELSRRARAIAKLVEKANGTLAACVVGRPGDDREGLPLGPDLSYRVLAAAVVEIFLYDWLPALELACGVPRTPMGAGVFLGTRVVPGKAADLIRHQWDYGQSIEEFQGDDRNPPNAVRASPGTVDSIGYSIDGAVAASPDAVAKFEICGRSMNFEDAYSLVLGIARQRGQGSRIRRATAVAMREYQGSPRRKLPWPPQLPRQVHYASDDLLHDPSLASGALAIGFEVAWSNQLPVLLQASRLLDSPSTLPEALQHLQRSWSDSTIESAKRWVAVRAESSLRTMCGGDFVRFALDMTMPVAVQRRTPAGKSPDRASHGQKPSATRPRATPSNAEKRDSGMANVRYRLEIGPFDLQAEAEKARDAMPAACQEKRTRETLKGKYMATSVVSGIERVVEASKRLSKQSWKVSYVEIKK